MSDLSSSEDESQSSRVQNACSSLLNAKPEFKLNVKPNSVIRTKLNSCKSAKKSPRKLRSNGKTTDRKIIEESFQELSSYIMGVHRKLGVIVDSVLDVLDRMDALENRLNDIEDTLKKSKASEPSYANTVITGSSSNSRLDKLEYISSEEARKNRLIQISLTNPSFVNVSVNDLQTRTRDFFINVLRMSDREIDANFNVQKTKKENTVIVILSDKRFKKFIYVAKKKIRHELPETLDNIYINDNLTAYNHSLLMSLKRDRTIRRNEGRPTFDTVYTFEGKVFVKRCRSDRNEEAVYIKNKQLLEDFLKNVDGEN